MIKKGYTLAEVLITLAVIGVASALMLPAVNSIKPDPIKMKFLKVYDSLSETVKDMASNTRIFPECTNPDANNHYTCYHEGYLFLNTAPLLDNNNATVIAGGNGKLCRAMAQQYTGGDGNCTNNFSDFMNGRRFSFEIPTTGEIIYVASSHNNNISTTQIAFDIDGNGNGVDCIYNQNNCRKPDTFVLWVTANGSIFPGDRVTEYYLKTRKNVKTKNYDIRNHNNNTLRNAVDFSIPAGVVENF